LSELSIVQSRDEMVFISNISVRTFENSLSSTVQFILDCTLTSRRFSRGTLSDEKYQDLIIGKLEFVEVDLHTLQGLFREFEQGKGRIKINLLMNEQ
jgi:hypothetical protein